MSRKYFSCHMHFNVSLFFWRKTFSCSLMSVVVPFAAFYISPRVQCNFSEVFAENLVGMQILREQDSI